MNDCVDILLASYEGEEFIAEQLESILDQTHKNFRIIVGDDGSKDSTVKIISQYEQKTEGKIQLCSFFDNVGPILNFSRLGSYANSDYIMFSDQDDIWLPNKVEKTLIKMKQLEAEYGKKKPLLVHTDLSVVDENLKMIQNSFWDYSLYSHDKTALSKVLIQNSVISPTIMINKALLEMAFPIPHNVYMHDHWLNLVATLFGKVGAVQEKTMYYRQHSNNLFGAYKRSDFKPLHSLLKDRKTFKNSSKILESKIVQAHILYKRYFEFLNNETKDILEKFITIKNNSLFKEIKTRFHYNFYRGGFCMGIYDIFTSIFTEAPKIENDNNYYLKK